MTNISFVIPAYNAASTLAESVGSIFDGNIDDHDEVLIVNDCSTDDTAKVISDLVRRYPSKITAITNTENKGCPASRNIGIRASKNPLIFNLDSDNILPRNSVAALKNALLSENADVATFKDYYYFKTDTSMVTHKWICQAGIFTLASLFSGMVNPAPGGNFLYKRSVWEKVGGYWEYGKGLHEAWGFCLKLLINGARFTVVPDTFYFHRYSHESLFVRENNKVNESIKITRKFIGPAFHLLNEKSLNYISTEPRWFDKLETHPLFCKDGSVGKNGKIVFTSTLKQILYSLKKMFK